VNVNTQYTYGWTSAHNSSPTRHFPDNDGPPSESSLLLRKSQRGRQAGQDACCSRCPSKREKRASKSSVPSAQLDDTPCEGNMARQQGPSSDSSRPSLTPVPPTTTTTPPAKPGGRCRAVLVTTTHAIAPILRLQPWRPPTVLTMLISFFSYRGIKDRERKRENATSSCGNSQSKPNAVRMRELCILRSLKTIKLLPCSECPLYAAWMPKFLLPPLPRSFSRLLTLSLPLEPGQPSSLDPGSPLRSS
jgi:hypothetical protein